MMSIYPNDNGRAYAEKVDALLDVEIRERVFQDYIINPFLQSVLKEYDVVPVDVKIAGKKHKYELYCGQYGYVSKDKTSKIGIETPDLCVARKWKWFNDNIEKENYILTVEIKTPFSKKEFLLSPGYIDGKNVFEKKTSNIVEFINEKMLTKNSQGEYRYDKDSCYSKSIEKQIGIHLRCTEKVIATDCVRWIFLYRKNGCCFEFATIDLGKRICEKQGKCYKHIKIDWDDKNFSLLQKTIKMFCKNNINDLDKLSKEIISELMN